MSRLLKRIFNFRNLSLGCELYAQVAAAMGLL